MISSGIIKETNCAIIKSKLRKNDYDVVHGNKPLEVGDMYQILDGDMLTSLFKTTKWTWIESADRIIELAKYINMIIIKRKYSISFNFYSIH